MLLPALNYKYNSTLEHKEEGEKAKFLKKDEEKGYICDEIGKLLTCEWKIY